MVLMALEQAENPLSPYEIQRLLQEEGKHLDPVTIYRILDLFCSLNLVHRVWSRGGFVRCTLGDEGGCHRYMVCRNCGDLQEFADKLLCHTEDEVTEKFGFYTEYHITEFSGLCSHCHETSKGC